MYRFYSFLMLPIFSLLLTSLELHGKTYQDLAGRKVTIEKPVQRIILMEGRSLYIFSLLESGNPFKKIVGMGSDLRIYDEDAYKSYLKYFEESMAPIKEVGDPYKGDYNVEFLVNLNPDLIVFSLYHYDAIKASQLIEKLEMLSIPSIFIDFRMKPLENTLPSVKLLGELLGAHEKVEQFSQYYQKQINFLADRLSQKNKKIKKPTVFIEIGAGIFLGEKEFKTFGNVNIGEFIEKAGGIHLGSELHRGFTTTVSMEWVLKKDPDIILITDCKEEEGEAGVQDTLSLGYHANDMDNIQKILRKFVYKISIHKYLKAFKDKKFYAIYQQFYNSPYHFVLMLQFAKWFHPELFNDINPKDIFIKFHKEFLAIPYSGNFWAEF